MHAYHLAQLNIGRLAAPLDSPQLAGFVARLEGINALAEASPGFVWRFQTEAGDATALRPYDDDRILVNFSVWESPEALYHYVYRTAHAELLRQRREWFEKMEESFMVLWWVRAGHQPDVAEAVARLALLRTEGPSASAFTFRAQFPPPDLSATIDSASLPDACPAT